MTRSWVAEWQNPAHRKPAANLSTGCLSRHCQIVTNMMWPVTQYFLMTSQILARHQASFHSIHSCSAPWPEALFPFSNACAIIWKYDNPYKIVQILIPQSSPGIGTVHVSHWPHWPAHEDSNGKMTRFRNMGYHSYFRLLFGHSLPGFTKCSGRQLRDDKMATLHENEGKKGRGKVYQLGRKRKITRCASDSSFVLLFSAYRSLVSITSHVISHREGLVVNQYVFSLVFYHTDDCVYLGAVPCRRRWYNTRRSQTREGTNRSRPGNLAWLVKILRNGPENTRTTPGLDRWSAILVLDAFSYKEDDN